VWSVDEHQRLVPAQLVNAFPSGIKPVFRLQLASGRSVDATANHKFLTVDGWVRLDELERGSVVAVPRRLPAPMEPGQAWSDDELALLGHMIGGGSMGPGFTYRTADRANRQLVEELARRLFGIEAGVTEVAGTWNLWFPSPYRLTRGVYHPMRNWPEPLGLWKSPAWDTFIPAPIFGLADESVALFLHHLWATDGSITIGRDNSGPIVSTDYETTSRRLALDVQRLLLRLGVRSTIAASRKQRAGRPADGVQYYRQAYSVRMQGAASQARFLRVVGCHGQRGNCIPAALAILDGIKENSNVDLVPWPVAARVNAAADVATSDLFWDEVVEITSLGPQPTFDATVEGTHNFVADGVVAHNSLEQDADVVIFLYRDEVYNRDTPDRGTAEVIVAKHRNGPIGVTHLAFLDHYTRFANMARV
jgi:replicative DNA helicase